MPSKVALEELRLRLREISDLSAVSSVLHWDQTTFMPVGGALSRSRQLALLGRLSHERATDPELGALLNRLIPYAESLPPGHDDRALIEVAQRDYDLALRVPAEFSERAAGHMSKTYAAWVAARPRNDFAALKELLETTLVLSREYCEFFPDSDHIADPLIDAADHGMTVARIRPVFAELRTGLISLLDRISDSKQVDDGALRNHFPSAQQTKFSSTVIQAMGYDFDRGRLDPTAHPFMTRFAHGDVRITTRTNESFLGEHLFVTIHEAGHALYEQGTCADDDGTPLGSGTSSGMHESQSRLWENIVARSPEFWSYWYPELQTQFPEQLQNVQLHEFYNAINRVQPSLIRTDADEVTYNLHVMLRFELELDLLEGNISITDLPNTWNERYRTDLGVSVPDDRDGVLQDVHWYAGFIGGAFQGYTLGNIIGAQLFDAALRDTPEISAQIGRGEYQPLHDWLRKNIYRIGRRRTPDQLIADVTGGPLDAKPLLNRLQTKFSNIYPG